MESTDKKIYLHKNLYDKRSIQEAVKDYVSICTMELKEEKNYYVCIIYNPKAEMSLIKKEFINYVIGLGVKSKRCLQ